MANYRYFTVDLLTHKPIAELPLQHVKFGSVLNGAGTLRAGLVLPTETAAAKIARTFNDAVDAWRRVVYVEREGVLLWGGPIVEPAYTSTSRSHQVDGVEWWAAFRRRLITDTKTFTAASDDQLAIARALIDYTQAKPGGDFGVTTAAQTSGRLRDRVYNYYEFKNLAQAVEELAAVEDGFDFSIDLSYSGATIVRKFMCWYPRRGRPAGSTGLIWSSRKNIIDFDWPQHGAGCANSFYGIGAGEGDAMLRSSAVRPELWAAGYPLLEDSTIRKDISIQDTLDRTTRAQVTAKGAPVELPTFRVRGDADPIIGSYLTGDEARFVLEPGWDPRFPDGLDTVRRIVAFDVEPSDSEGQEIVTLTTDLPFSI